MAGFFGLFGSKTKYVDEEGTTQEVQESSESFFLSPDDAKSFGNIDYMRTPKKIRRTFPKTKSNQNTEYINEVASIKIDGTSAPQATTQPVAPQPQATAQPVAPQPQATTQPVAPQPQATTQPVAPQPQATFEAPKTDTRTTEERRRDDSSMDMFRNMARQINK